MRRVVLALSLSIVACAAGVVPGHADRAPQLVIPGRAGVPIIINGQDVSYAVIEGDWGLSRPGAGPYNVIYPRPVMRAPSEYGFFPHTGKPPRAGRLEIEPPANRVQPRPVPSFQRVWSVEPEPLVQQPPQNPPAVIVAPNFDRRRPVRPRH